MMSSLMKKLKEWKKKKHLNIETKVQLLVDKYGAKDVVEKITHMTRDDYERS